MARDMDTINMLLAQAGTGDTLTSADVTSVELTQYLTRLAIEWGGRVVGVLVLLVAAWLLGFYVRRAIGRLFDKTRVDKTLARFLGNMARWLIFVMGIVACLGLFGFNITSVAALVGAAGLTVGLAMQGSLSNLAAGIMLMLLRPFKIGDVVSLAGQIGKVDDLDLFNTKIDTGDNRRLIIPNGQIFGSTIENITHHPFRRVEVNVGVAYSADLYLTRTILKASGESLPTRDQSKAVEVLLVNLGNNAVEWTVRVWVPAGDFITAKDQLLVEIKTRLDAAGLSIPFPQLELWFRNPLPGKATPQEAAPVAGSSN